MKEIDTLPLDERNLRNILQLLNEVVENQNEIVRKLGEIEEAVKFLLDKPFKKEWWHSNKCLAYKGKGMCNMNCLTKFADDYPTLVPKQSESALKPCKLDGGIPHFKTCPCPLNKPAVTDEAEAEVDELETIELDTLVRDLTKVCFMAKSEARRRIKDFTRQALASQKAQIRKQIEELEPIFKEDFKCGGCNECEACYLVDDKVTKAQFDLIDTILSLPSLSQKEEE